MSKDKPMDAVLQQQIEYFAAMIRKATSCKTIIVIAVSGDEDLDIQAALHTPEPDRLQDLAQVQGEAGLAMIIAAATVLEKHTGGKFQLMVKKPNGELKSALSDDMARAMVDKGL